jgi:hypothetical protein
MRPVLNLLLLCCLAPSLWALDYYYYSPADSILYVQFPTVEQFDEDWVLLRFWNHGYDVNLPATDAPGTIVATDGTPGHILVSRDSTDGSRWFFRSTDYGESWTLAPLSHWGGSGRAFAGYAGRNPGESWMHNFPGEAEGDWAFFTHDGWLSYDSARIPTLINGGPDYVRVYSLSHDIGTLYGARQGGLTLCVSSDTGNTWAVGSRLPTQITEHGGCGATDEIWYRLFYGAHVVLDTGRVDLAVFAANPRYPQAFPWQSFLVGTDHPGEAYLVLWYDEWPPPPNWSLLSMWVYHIQNYGAAVDSSYHLFLDFVPVAVETEHDVLPHDLHLTAYPNPFNSSTQIEFTLPSTQRVSLRLYDVLGREVAVLMNEIQTAGLHRLTFDASGLPSGVYLCRLEAGEMVQTRKIVLVK